MEKYIYFRQKIIEDIIAPESCHLSSMEEEYEVFVHLDLKTEIILKAVGFYYT